MAITFCIPGKFHLPLKFELEYDKQTTNKGKSAKLKNKHLGELGFE